MNWNFFRSDLRAFGRLAHYAIATGEDSRLSRLLLRGEKSIPLIGASLDMLALVLCWRVACWPRAVTLVVTPVEAQAGRLFMRAERMMAEADEVLRERVFFLPEGRGMTCEVSSRIGVAHCRSGTLGMDLPQLPATGEDPLTFLIPSIDLIPGTHIRYIPRLKERNATTTICNVLKEGRL